MISTQASTHAPGFRVRGGRSRPGGRIGAWSLRHLAFTSRRSFTLVELLTVITIIGMLASISLGALYSARESARVAKTRATIAKLDVIVQARYEEFVTRRIPIRARRIPPKAMAELRLQVLRELIRMEMPDRLTDITYPRHDINNRHRSDINATFTVSAGGIPEEVARPALNKRYFQQVYDMSRTDGTLHISEEFAPAELLYLIVMSDPDARERFQDNEIGDTDGDGFFEFIDGWGRPIMFLRWAPGFRSDLQTGDLTNDPDPFDSRRIDTAAFRLVPMIYSSGPDKEYGITTENQADPWVFQFGIKDTHVSRLYTHLASAIIGEPEGNETHHDNIHNHQIETGR